MRTYAIIGSVILLLIAGFLLHMKFFKRPVITIYIENNSFDLPEIDLKLLIDNELIAENLFKVDSVAPSFRIYEVQTDKGAHVLKVTSATQNLTEIDTLEVREDNHIFVSFDFKLKGNYQYEQEKLRFESLYPKDQYPDRKFDFDSVATAPQIKIHVTRERPVVE